MKIHSNAGPQEGQLPDGTAWVTDGNDDIDLPTEVASGYLEQTDKWVKAKAAKGDKAGDAGGEG